MIRECTEDIIRERAKTDIERTPTLNRSDVCDRGGPHAASRCSDVQGTTTCVDEHEAVHPRWKATRQDILS
jgi:hypothetical protein